MASASGRARAEKMEKNDGNGIAVGTTPCNYENFMN